MTDIEQVNEYRLKRCIQLKMDAPLRYKSCLLLFDFPDLVGLQELFEVVVLLLGADLS